jgi:hypothetical protein
VPRHYYPMNLCVVLVKALHKGLKGIYRCYILLAVRVCSKDLIDHKGNLLGYLLRTLGKGGASIFRSSSSSSLSLSSSILFLFFLIKEQKVSILQN